MSRFPSNTIAESPNALLVSCASSASHSAACPTLSSYGAPSPPNTVASPAMGNEELSAHRWMATDDTFRTEARVLILKDVTDDGCWAFASGLDSAKGSQPVSYTHLRAHETDSYLVC